MSNPFDPLTPSRILRCSLQYDVLMKRAANDQVEAPANA